MKKLFNLISLILISSFLLALSGCNSSPKPEDTVKNLFSAISKSDIKTASSYFENGNSNFKYDNQQQEQILNIIFSKLKCEIVSTTTQDNTSIVKTKIIAPDLTQVTKKMITDLFPKLLSMAFTDSATKEADSSKLVNDYFIKSISDPNISLTISSVDINLIKNDKGKWLIKSDDNLTNAMTGNIATAFKSLNSAESNTSQQDPQADVPDNTLYKIGKEAVYGRAAITVLNVKKSNGSDFDKPKKGNEFIIIRIRERNIGKGSISSDPYSFKLQNSNGQIVDSTFTSINTDTNLESSELVSGGKVEGTLAFEAPKNDPNLTFLFVPEQQALLKFSIK